MTSNDSDDQDVHASATNASTTADTARPSGHRHSVVRVHGELGPQPARSPRCGGRWLRPIRPNRPARNPKIAVHPGAWLLATRRAGHDQRPFSRGLSISHRPSPGFVRDRVCTVLTANFSGPGTCALSILEPVDASGQRPPTTMPCPSCANGSSQLVDDPTDPDLIARPHRPHLVCLYLCRCTTPPPPTQRCFNHAARLRSRHSPAIESPCSVHRRRTPGIRRQSASDHATTRPGSTSCNASTATDARRTNSSTNRPEHLTHITTGPTPIRDRTHPTPATRTGQRRRSRRLRRGGGCGRIRMTSA